MENEKKELNSSEMDQVNGGQKGIRIHNTNKRIGEKISGNKTKEEKEREVVTAMEETGTGLLVKKAINWISGLFSGND